MVKQTVTDLVKKGKADCILVLCQKGDILYSVKHWLENKMGAMLDAGGFFYYEFTENDTKYYDDHAYLWSIFDKLKRNKWVVLADHSFARGFDFRGVSPAHVVLALNNITHSLLFQALGRGSRNFDSGSRGYVFTQD